MSENPFKIGDKISCILAISEEAGGPKVGEEFVVSSIDTYSVGFPLPRLTKAYNHNVLKGIWPNWGYAGFKLVPETASATKYDDNKVDMSLLSSIAIHKIAQVMTFGKQKYAAHNWRKGFVWSRVLAATLRHVFAYLSGEDKDSESGLSHLAHAGCCIMFLLEFEDTHKELDDRYKESK